LAGAFFLRPSIEPVNTPEKSSEKQDHSGKYEDHMITIDFGMKLVNT
jgi:hypothetical protein